MPKTDFITLLRIANELFVMKWLLNKGFLFLNIMLLVSFILSCYDLLFLLMAQE